MFKNGNVTVTVSDFNRAVQFYVHTLGLSLQYEMPGHFAQVELPGLTISLVHPNGEHGPQPGKSESLAIGLEVADLETATDTLKTRGVVFAPIVEGEASKIANFSDPDGNPLYLIELKQP